VKPEHLKLGSQRDNMQDRLRDGRHHYSGVKLTAEDIPEIVRRYKAGEAQKEIAKDYGISSATVSGIIRGKYWSHVTAQLRLPRPRKNTGQRKLDEQTVRMIRAAYLRGETQQGLAVEHGISKALVQQIVTGRAWKHVQ
jgi:DNA invertase Pin-like site-specific DNA recombinase